MAACIGKPKGDICVTWSKNSCLEWGVCVLRRVSCLLPVGWRLRQKRGSSRYDTTVSKNWPPRPSLPPYEAPNRLVLYSESFRLHNTAVSWTQLRFAWAWRTVSTECRSHAAGRVGVNTTGRRQRRNVARCPPVAAQGQLNVSDDMTPARKNAHSTSAALRSEAVAQNEYSHARINRVED